MTQTNRVIGRPADRVSQQREAWRRAAQHVTRTWNDWSAADRRSRSDLYRRYASALEAEELAAATLEHLLRTAGRN